MDLAPLDLALLGVVALIVGIGLVRGLSGELASFAGFVWSPNQSGTNDPSGL